MAFTENLKGMKALVTGASSGIGSDFARILARQGSHVILVARRQKELQELQQQIAHKGTEVTIYPEDLTRPGAVEKLVQKFPDIDILINNAGFGIFGETASMDVARVLNMLDLNIRALTELTLKYLPVLKTKNRGYILQIASIAAYQACPYYAAYGATKAYVLNFSEALHEELRNTDVHVSTLSPGTTATSFFSVAGQKMSKIQALSLMKSGVVAEAGLEILFKRKASYIPGFPNRASIFLNRFFPRSLQRVVVERVLRP